MINVISIRSKITQAISKMPTEINLYRYVKVSDGMGGFITSKEPIFIAKFDALLDNSQHSITLGDTRVSDAAVIVIGRTTKLYAVWNALYEIKKKDIFTVAGIDYEINNPVNILNMNIYYECDLESVDKL